MDKSGIQNFSWDEMSEKEKYKLLVVDDNKDHCQIAKRSLEDNCDIEIAHSGEEAISKIYDFNPAVVLLDVKMPRLTGDELVKMIKAWKPEIHVIMLSAHFTPQIENECMLNGALACLQKPIDTDVLLETIRKEITS